MRATRCPREGILAISARRELVATSNRHELAPGEFVCIAVADTGTGMDETTLARAAEPFFTTKELGKGTGLGLSSVFGLAKQSGGTIRVASQLGVGTTVELWLPKARSQPVKEAAPAATDAGAVSRACNILLVDDDPMVAETTVNMLERLGHRVTVASSGRDALELLGSLPPVDLVITDHAMPGMTGKELAQRIRETRPLLPIVLASGYAELPGSDELGLPRLDKPYALGKLASIISTMI